MSVPGNTALAVEEVEGDEFGPDLLSDPMFVPCRNEGCGRKDLHREHKVSRRGRKMHEAYDKCPRCQTPVVVTKTRRTRIGTKQTRDVVMATCPACGWFHTKALKES